jgi:transcription-repair coupling factor (superfamily II helicase)
MLQEAIDSNPHTEEVSCEVVLPKSVYIPDSYIADFTLRLAIYRRAAKLKTPTDVEDLRVELADRFGSLPDEVNNLLETIKIKQIASSLGIEKLTLTDTSISIKITPPENPEKLIAYIMKNKQTMQVKDNNRILARIPAKHLDYPAKLKYLYQILGELVIL